MMRHHLVSSTHKTIHRLGSRLQSKDEYDKPIRFRSVADDDVRKGEAADIVQHLRKDESSDGEGQSTEGDHVDSGSTR